MTFQGSEAWTFVNMEGSAFILAANALILKSTFRRKRKQEYYIQHYTPVGKLVYNNL